MPHSLIGPSQNLHQMAKLFEQVPTCAHSKVDEVHKPPAKI